MSSAKAKRIVRRGERPRRTICRARSITSATLQPLSSAPVPRPQESRWAPSTTTSGTPPTAVESTGNPDASAIGATADWRERDGALADARPRREPRLENTGEVGVTFLGAELLDQKLARQRVSRIQGEDLLVVEVRVVGDDHDSV